MKLSRAMMIMLMINGCYSPNKANKAIEKAYDNYPEILAKAARDKFPCITMPVDSFTKTEYDFIEIKCPDVSSAVAKPDTLFIHENTKPKTYIVYKNRFIATPQTTKTIVKTIKDSAEIASYQYKINNAQKLSSKLTDKLDNKSNWIKWLLIILSISIIGNILFMTNKR